MTEERKREIKLFEQAGRLMRLLAEIDEDLYIILEDGDIKLRANDEQYGKTILVWES